MKDDNFVEFKILLVKKNRKENKKRKVTKRNYITKDFQAIRVYLSEGWG